MPFTALSADRGIDFAIRDIMPMEAPLDAAAGRASVVLVELPAIITGEVEAELADELVWTIRRVLERGARPGDDGSRQAVDVGMIGVACAHVSQVNAVRERLGLDLSGVFVEKPYAGRQKSHVRIVSGAPLNNGLSSLFDWSDGTVKVPILPSGILLQLNFRPRLVREAHD
jgi:hypothetical protein